MELDRYTAPWTFTRGAPFKSTSALELLASTVGLMLFAPEGTANWEGRFVASCFTDSQVASKVMDQFMSTNYPLCIVAVELSAQLEARQARLISEWAPRDPNCQAGALTNGIFEGFDDKLRIQCSVQALDFKVMDKMLDAAVAFESERVETVSHGDASEREQARRVR